MNVGVSCFYLKYICRSVIDLLFFCFIKVMFWLFFDVNLWVYILFFLFIECLVWKYLDDCMKDCECNKKISIGCDVIIGVCVCYDGYGGIDCSW